MDRKIQKVIEKLIQYGNKELSQFEEELLQNNFNQSKLAQAVILLHFQQLSFEGIVEEDNKHEVDILFLEPAKIFNALDNIVTNFKDFVLFLEWYLERFVAFYTTKTLEQYVVMGKILTYRINTYLGISEGRKKAIENQIRKGSKQEDSYASYKAIAKKMHCLYHAGILYTQQYDVLFELGMPQELVDSIKAYHVSTLMQVAEASLIKKREKKKTKNPSDALARSKSIEEQIIVQEASVSHRTIKEKLDKYVHLSTLQNKSILTGDALYEVESLLR